MKLAVTIVMLIALLLHAISAQAAAAGQPPDILLITCDNLGYGDLPCYNPKSNIQTPHLDRLASQGTSRNRETWRKTIRK